MTTEKIKTPEKPMTKEEQISLSDIFNKTQTQVFNQVRRTVKNLADVEDICSDVFIKIKKLNEKDSTRFDESRSNLNTWVHTVTNSVILDFFRTNHQDRYKAVSNFVDMNGSNNGDENKVYYNFVAPKSSSADSQILTAEKQERITNAFQSLKPDYRKIATLYFIKEYDYNEIADMLNVPMGTVKGMINRSRTKLQEALKGMYHLRAVKAETV